MKKILSCLGLVLLCVVTNSYGSPYAVLTPIIILGIEEPSRILVHLVDDSHLAFSYSDCSIETEDNAYVSSSEDICSPISDRKVRFSLLRGGEKRFYICAVTHEPVLTHVKVCLESGRFGATCYVQPMLTATESP